MPQIISPWDVLTSSGTYPERINSPECTAEVHNNAADTAERVSKLLDLLGIKWAKVASGFRTSASNRSANGAKASAHMNGEAVDLYDPQNTLDDSIMRSPHLLDACDLYMEAPQATPGWSHLSKRRPRSGSRIFIP